MHEVVLIISVHFCSEICRRNRGNAVAQDKFLCSDVVYIKVIINNIMYKNGEDSWPSSALITL